MPSDFMGTRERTPTNGQPYYCRVCGMGWNEFMACEEVDCELETEAEAQKRIPAEQFATFLAVPPGETNPITGK